MLAYRNGSDPSVANSTVLIYFKRNFLGLDAFGVDFSLDKVAPSGPADNFSTVFSPTLDMAPPGGGSWIRQTRFRGLWTHTLTFDNYTLRNTLRMFIRTRIAATSFPGGEIFDPSLQKTSSLNYTVACKVGDAWKNVTTTYEVKNVLELNQSSGDNVSAELIWGSSVFARILPKTTAVRITISGADWSNFFGVVGSQTGSSTFAGTGAFMLESVADIAIWYTDLSPREHKMLIRDDRMRTVFARRDELTNFIRSTVQQFDARLPPSSG